MEGAKGKIFDTVETYYQDYGVRARELKNEGKKVIGYVCSFVPLEIISASGAIPFRVRGNVHEPITKGDTPGSGDDFQRHEGTDITDNPFPLILQLPCPDPVILIIRFHRVKNVAFGAIHRLSPFTSFSTFKYK